MKIKHLSFDLWMTLIRSNLEFKKIRANNLYHEHNPLKYKLVEVEGIIKKTDDFCNAMNEITGKNISANEMYLLILYSLGNDIKTYNLAYIELLKQHFDTFFLDFFSPYPYDENTLESLMKLQDMGYTMSISSNTGFIEGHILRTLFDKTGLIDFFTFCIFSDEIACSKPSANFYQKVWEKTQAAYEGLIDKNEVLHIGDNPNADILGAAAFGFRTLQLNTNQTTIQDLVVFLEHEKNNI